MAKAKKNVVKLPKAGFGFKPTRGGGQSGKKLSSRHRPKGLNILYEDDWLLVVEKMSGLLTMTFNPKITKTAENTLNEYVKKGSQKSKNRVFVVHRLDRETSGVLIFAKDEPTKKKLKDNWQKVEKYYLAAVHGRLTDKEAIISSYLAEDKDQYVYSTDDDVGGRFSQTQYKVIKQTRNLSVVKINLLTGQKNQIRVHFAELGHPIAGDPKYGKPDKYKNRMALHAQAISFIHPRTRKRITVGTEIPEHFKWLAGGLEMADWDVPFMENALEIESKAIKRKTLHPLEKNRKPLAKKVIKRGGLVEKKLAARKTAVGKETVNKKGKAGKKIAAERLAKKVAKKTVKKSVRGFGKKKRG